MFEFSTVFVTILSVLTVASIGIAGVIHVFIWAIDNLKNPVIITAILLTSMSLVMSLAVCLVKWVKV